MKREEISYAKKTVTFKLETPHQVAAVSTMADIIVANGWTLVHPEFLLWAMMDLHAGIGDGKLMGAEIFGGDADSEREARLWKLVAKYCVRIAKGINDRLAESD